MNPKLLMFVSFVFLLGTLCCLVIEGSYFGEAEIGIVNELTGYNIIQVSGAGVWSIAKMGWGFLTHGVPKMIMWDYNFFQGAYIIIRIFLIMTLSVGVVWGITQALIPVAQGILARFIG